MVIFVLLANFVLEEFKLGRVEGSVANHVSKNSNSFACIILENLEAIADLLLFDLAGPLSSHAFDLSSQFGL